MYQRFIGSTAAAMVMFGLLGSAIRAADNYTVDPMHSSVSFKISHLGLSWVHGRFDDLSGNFAIDADNPSACSFEMSIKAQSVDTNNQKRDEHLRSPDFFNVKQFPVITFKSTAVKPTNTGFEVTGDVTMHGVTKSVTIPMVGGRKAEFPKGMQRTGYTTEFVLKRADFGMDKMLNAIGGDVHVAMSFEGVRK
jgi:polyisoprenoid-binding protein YceI